MRDTYTVRRSQSGEIVAFHSSRKAFTDRCSSDVNPLTNYKMVNQNFCTRFNKSFLANPKLS